jgi:hypothetical protein
MTKTGAETERERESRAALERIRRETDTVGASSLARMSRRVGHHFAGADAEAEGVGADPIEVWGRRIGRALSVGLAGLLVFTLGLQLGWW